MSRIKSIIKHNVTISELVKSDIINRYLGNYLGIVWTLLYPIIMVFIYWAVFSKGFGVLLPANNTYLLWLLTGMIPWFFFNDALANAGQSICAYSFLVKKIVFKVELLPLIKIISAFLINIVFWLLLIIICFYNRSYPSLIWVQLIYYFCCAFFLCYVLGLLLASLTPFIPDVQQVVNIGLQILFWITPITWDFHRLKGSWQILVVLNPMAYVIDGFRETIIESVPFWQNIYGTLFFWIFICVFYYLSDKIFQRLRPHFADVL